MKTGNTKVELRRGGVLYLIFALNALKDTSHEVLYVQEMKYLILKIKKIQGRLHLMCDTLYAIDIK